MKNKTIQFVLQSAIIAAIYTSVTLLLAPISYGPIQFRVGEALTILPALTPAGIYGISIGCLISNIVGPYGIIDVVCGTAATILGAIFSYMLRNRPLLVPLPPVLLNGVIIGGMLHFAFGVPNLLLCMLWISFGQFVVCYLLGYPLLLTLRKRKDIFKLENR